jgi:hypothetical protein
VAFSPDEKYVVTHHRDTDQVFVAWDQTGKLLHKFPGKRQFGYRVVSFSNDGKVILSGQHKGAGGGGDGAEVVAWDLRTGETQDYPLSYDSKFTGKAGTYYQFDGKLHLFRVGEKQPFFSKEEDSIPSVFLSSDGLVGFICYPNKPCELWDMVARMPLMSFSGDGKRPVVSADGSMVAFPMPHCQYQILSLEKVTAPLPRELDLKKTAEILSSLEPSSLPLSLVYYLRRNPEQATHVFESWGSDRSEISDEDLQKYLLGLDSDKRAVRQGSEKALMESLGKGAPKKILLALQEKLDQHNEARASGGLGSVEVALRARRLVRYGKQGLASHLGTQRLLMVARHQKSEAAKKFIRWADPVVP